MNSLPCVSFYRAKKKVMAPPKVKGKVSNFLCYVGGGGVVATQSMSGSNNWQQSEQSITHWLQSAQ